MAIVAKLSGWTLPKCHYQSEEVTFIKVLRDSKLVIVEKKRSCFMEHSPVDSSLKTPHWDDLLPLEI